MSLPNNLLDIVNIIVNFLYTEEKIKPKYIIFCNGDKKKKVVYQSTPKEIKTYEIDENINAEITHQIYIQNTINIDDNIENYTHVIIVDENQKEYNIKKEFLLKNMFNNIHNTINKEYIITKIMDSPFMIEDIYNKNNEYCKDIIMDNKKSFVIGSVLSLLTIGVVGAFFKNIKL